MCLICRVSYLKLLCSHTVIKDVSWMGGGGGWRCRGARAGGRYWLRIINRCIVHIVHIVRFASKGHIDIFAFYPTKITRYTVLQHVSTNHTPSVFSVCSSSVLVTGRRGGRAGEGNNESCFMDYNYRSYYN